MYRYRRAHAFTLIELVVVTGCVALLVGIVQPSLQASLGQSRNTVCLDRLRAIGQANLTYSQDEPDGWALPIHPLQFQQDPNNPTYIGAYEWGGKSGVGRPDYVDPEHPTSVGSRYGTRAGFGPAARPLNSILYPHGFRDNNQPAFNRTGATIDTQLQLDAFRCPADDGPPDGGHCPDWIVHPKQSSFDHFGTSYAANIFMISSGGGGTMLSNSPYLRPLSRVPNPGRTLNFEENIGRWAWAARRELPLCDRIVGPGIDPGPTGVIRGWHGKNWSYNRAFVDSHAETQAIYVEGTEDSEGYALHYRNQQLADYPDFPNCSGCAPGSKDCSGEAGSFEAYRCIIVRGDGWQKDTMPAPLICTGLYWGGYGRPSYEDCVAPGETAARGMTDDLGGAR